MFYSSLDFVWDNLGLLVPEGTFRHLLDFLVQNEDNVQSVYTTKHHTIVYLIYVIYRMQTL